MLINIIAKVNGKNQFSLIDVPLVRNISLCIILYTVLCFAFQPCVKFMHVMFIATLPFFI